MLIQCHQDRVNGFTDSLGNPVLRATKLTGLSRGVLLDINTQLQEGEWPKGADGLRGRYHRDVIANDRTVCTKIRETVDLMHRVGIMASVPKIRKKLSFHHGILMSKSLLKRVMKKMGFQFRAPTAEETVYVTETKEMRALRYSYLQNVIQARENGRTIVYLDESYVNKNHTSSRCWVYKGCQVKRPTGKGPRWILCGAGCRDGWIHCEVFQGKSDGDYHSSINAKKFEVWINKGSDYYSKTNKSGQE